MTVRLRMGARRIAAFALAAALGGCVAQPPAPIIEKPAASPGAAPGDASERDTASLPAETPESGGVTVVVPVPETLLGMGHAEIVKIFGQPDFRRRDVPALLMRYRDAHCILDLFLYPPAGPRKESGPAVEHVEARRVDGSRIATQACIASVMKSRAARAPG